MFIGSENMATRGTENWPLLITLLLIDASSHENFSECPHKAYFAETKLDFLANISVADSMGVSLFVFA